LRKTKNSLYFNVYFFYITRSHKKQSNLTTRFGEINPFLAGLFPIF